MPCIPFDARTISYTPQCNSNQGQTSFPGDTGTTYDKAFSLPTDSIKVPMWWYIVIGVSEGMTSAANTMVSCVPDLRKMITRLETEKKDPILNKKRLEQLGELYKMARKDIRTIEKRLDKSLCKEL